MTEKLLASLQGMSDSILAAAPKVVTAVVLLLVAWIVAKLIERALRALLTRLKLDELADKAGVKSALQRIGLRQELRQFLPRLVYFLLLFLVVKTLTDALGLVALSDAIGAFFGFLPNLISALLVLLLAAWAAPVVGGAVATAAKNSGIDFGSALGNLVSALIFFVAGIIAFAQLEIDTEIIHLVAAFGLAAFALAFGLSFGLGSRELTRNILAGFYARKIFKIGEPLEIGEQRGVLKAITSTHTLIESAEERTISIANDTFLEQISKQ